MVNYSNPFVLDEIYNEQTKNRFIGVLATFGVEQEALIDVISGKFNPLGKMTFTTPVSQQAVETNKEMFLVIWKVMRRCNEGTI